MVGVSLIVLSRKLTYVAKSSTLTESIMIMGVALALMKLIIVNCLKRLYKSLLSLYKAF